MNVDSNSYTFGFATIMVIIVAALLSYAAIELKPFQDTNIELEKQQNILSSVGINVERDLAEEAYSKYIKKEIVLNYKGEEVDGSAFDIELAKELKKDNSAQLLPLFISNIDSVQQYIIPLRGKGLWGPIWGFIALEEDLNSILIKKLEIILTNNENGAKSLMTIAAGKANNFNNLLGNSEKITFGKNSATKSTNKDEKIT